MIEKLGDKDIKKFERIKNIVNLNTNYQTVKYKNENYSIGDYLLLKDSVVEYIGKLIEIIPAGGIENFPYWPSIKVNM
jgi:hypothetical protein